MATPPVTPDPGAAPGMTSAAPADQQANQLQVTLAKLAQLFEQLGSQNAVIADDCMAARQSCISALQKTMMAGQPQAAPNPAPPQG